MRIDNWNIGPYEPPYMVAEISGNHLGDKQRAYDLIKAAKKAGANAVKFQAYTPDTITLNHKGSLFQIHEGPWKGKTLYELYREAHTPLDWLIDLFACARDNAIIPFASVFDKSSVDLLEGLDCPAYKIASFELVDIPLIEYAAQTGKPMILSTGMADWHEINEADDAIPDNVSRAFLHCVSGYPTPVWEANLGRIKTLSNKLSTIIGLSDHSQGITIPIVAAALEARIIEKHLTLDRADGGPDAEFSLEPDEFSTMAIAVNQVWRAMQNSTDFSADTSKPLRRSLFVVRDIAAGEKITELNVRSIRPGYGLPPKFLPLMLGRYAPQAIRRGTPLSLDLLGMRLDHQAPPASLDTANSDA